MFITSSGTWTFTSMSCAHAATLIHTYMKALVPERLHQMLGVTCPNGWLPYMYVTIKSKCFRGGVRVCTRAGHSRLRKVASSAAWPMRRRWRYIHRALETVMREYSGGDEVWSLRQATHVMNARIQAARPVTAHGTCARCQRVKAESTVVVADAGQFFEAVRPRDAIFAARTVLQRCQRATGKEAVTVLKNGRRVAFIGGSGGVHDSKKVCLFSLICCLLSPRACL